MKTCTKCGETKAFDEFYKSNGKPVAACKECTKAKQRQWWAANPERARALRRQWYANHAEEDNQRSRQWRHLNADEVARKNRARHIRRRYGLSVEEYDALIAKGCGICGSTDRMHLDHDHDGGQIRAALCNRCNMGLGLFGHDPDRLRLAAEYMEVHTTEGVTHE